MDAAAEERAQGDREMDCVCEFYTRAQINGGPEQIETRSEEFIGPSGTLPLCQIRTAFGKVLADLNVIFANAL